MTNHDEIPLGTRVQYAEYGLYGRGWYIEHNRHHTFSFWEGPFQTEEAARKAFVAATQPLPEPAAWAYETATRVDAIGQWAGFQWRLSRAEPRDPPGSTGTVRNVQPLYATPPDMSENPAPGPKVKALEWTQKAPPGHKHEAFVYWAAGLGGHYKAERDGLLWVAHDAFGWKQYASQKEAKVAAQANYEARILSALSLSQGDK